MRVVLISQYFPPETGGPPNRALSLAQGIRAAGHEVLVVAEKPSHPEGRIWPAFRWRVVRRQEYEGIPVLYVWVLASPKKSLWARVGNHLSFMFLAFAALIVEGGRIDIVLSTSPPLFVGVAGWAGARLRGAAHVLDVRDLWPDIAVAMGELNNPLWIRLSKVLERGLYQSADAISAVTESFRRVISAEVRGSVRVELIRNGSELDFFDSDSNPSEARARLGIPPGPSSLRVAYVGNVGLPQGLMHLVEAARILDEREVDFELWIVGTGPTRKEIEAAVQRDGPARVRFVGRVDQAAARDWMAAADILLVSLADVEMLGQFVPSKLYDALATGRPVLLGAPDGDARRILEESEGGFAYAAEDAQALASAIAHLADDRELRTLLGKKGRAFARLRLGRAEQTAQMVNLLSEVVAQTRGRRASPPSS